MPTTTPWPLYDTTDDFPPGIADFLADYPELSWMFLRRHHMDLGRILGLMVSFVILVMGSLVVFVVASDRGMGEGVAVAVVAFLWALVAMVLTRGHRLAVRWSDVAGVVIVPLAMAATLPWIRMVSIGWERGAETFYDERIGLTVLIGLGLWALAMAARLASMLMESLDHWHGRRALTWSPTADDGDVAWVGSLGERLDTQASRSLFVRAVAGAGYSRVAAWMGGMMLANMLTAVAGGIDYARDDIAFRAVGIVVLIGAAAILDAGRPTLTARCTAITVIVLVVVSIMSVYSVFGSSRHLRMTVEPVFLLYYVFIVLSGAATFLSILTNHIKRLRLLGDTVE